MSNLAQFFSELRRRRVFRVAAFYGGIAFVIIQIIDGTFALMGVPEWVGRMMVVLLILGFPISMILAWIFDITEEGIVRAKGRPTDAPRKAVLIVSNPFLITITVIAVIVAGWSWFGGEAESQEIFSIAVLPLENISNDPDQAYFVAGMHEALTAELSKISALRVIGRTSTMSYKGTTKTLSEIAKELGVDALIEGSVLLAGNEVRITAQLVATKPERHLWADDYVRSIDKVLVLHKEVAQAIAREIRVTLTPNEVTHLNALQPTVNPEAYHAFLRARYFAALPHFTSENWTKVLKYYQQAVDIDPNYALAYAELARAHATLHYFQHDLSKERLEMATQAAERALELAPESPEVHLHLSYYYLHAFRDTAQAFRELKIAESGLPNNAETYKARYYIYNLHADPQSLKALKTALELSPRDAIIVTEYLFQDWFGRHYPRGIEYANRAIELMPNAAWPYLGKAYLYWCWNGNTEAARATLDAMPVELEWGQWYWFWQEIYEGDYQAALDRLSKHPDEWIKVKMHARPVALFSAYAYELLNEPQLAREAYETAKTLLEAEVKKWPQDPRMHSSLGIVYAALGRKEEAIREGKQAVVLLPISKDYIYGWPSEEDLAHIYTAAGEYDLAMDQVERLLAMPSFWSIGLIQIDPRFASLRDLPRYKALVEKYGASI